MDALMPTQLADYKQRYPKTWDDKYAAHYEKGDVIEVRPDGYFTGSGKGYNKAVFCLVIVSGVDAEKHEHLMEEDKVADSLDPVAGTRYKLLHRRRHKMANVTDLGDTVHVAKMSDINVIDKKP
jgi:hypothetical protein